jgi:hypothetical protein
MRLFFLHGGVFADFGEKQIDRRIERRPRQYF